MKSLYNNVYLQAYFEYKRLEKIWIWWATNLHNKCPTSSFTEKRRPTAFRNDHIEPEHLLLGILRDGECKAAEILKSFYLDLKGIKNELETQLREKSILENYSQDISFSEEASKIWH